MDKPEFRLLSYSSVDSILFSSAFIAPSGPWTYKIEGPSGWVKISPDLTEEDRAQLPEVLRENTIPISSKIPILIFTILIRQIHSKSMMFFLSYR